MNMAKFVSMLQNRGLFFSRVDCLGDAWEGVPPRATGELLKAVEDALVEHGDEYMRAELRGTWKRNYDVARSRNYASCWQAAARDAWWMWKVYCDSDFGIAVCSTYDLLDRELPLDVADDRHIMLGCVTYGDYDSSDYTTEVSNVYSPVMSKRDAFSDEKEVRALCDAGASPEHSKGFYVSANMNRLITAVVVSPVAPEWFRATIEGLTRALGCTAPVEDSRLRREPKLPF
jgi:hypothetical protein